MELAEIASHLRLPVDHVEQLVYALVEAEMARITKDDLYVTLLQRGYAESQRS